MKLLTSKLMVISVILIAQPQTYAGNKHTTKTWTGTWEQTKIYNKASKKECRIEQLLKFQYVFDKNSNSQIKGSIVQTDYRFNITSPPNPACEFTNTKIPNTLHNVKKWKVTGEVNKINNTLSIVGHSGRCTFDHCKSPQENDFKTKIVMGNEYILDDFGTDYPTDDIYLIGKTKRDALLTAAKIISIQAEKYITKKNCAGLHTLVKKNRQYNLTDDYLENCNETYKLLPDIKSYLEIDRFLSYDPNAHHWAVFVNKVTYRNNTEKNELMYLVYEDNVWKFWSIY